MIAAVWRRPRRFIAWPAVATGALPANAAPLALRISVAAIATSASAMRATAFKSGSRSAIARCSRVSSSGQGGTTICCSGPRRLALSISSTTASTREAGRAARAGVTAVAGMIGSRRSTP